MKKSEGPDLKKQIFVIGAGASGLMAAIQAAVSKVSGLVTLIK